MHIKSLQIKNFRCFDKEGVLIDFNDNLTSIVGRNGSGKTAILEALNYLIGQDYLPSKVSERDFHEKATDIKDEILINGKTSHFFILIDTVSLETTQPERVAVPCNKVTLSIKRRQKAEKILDEPFVIIKSVSPVLGEIENNFYDNLPKIKARKATKVEALENFFEITYELKSGEKRSSHVVAYDFSFNPTKLLKFPKAYYLDKNRDREVSGPYSFVGKVLTDLHWKHIRSRQRSSEEDTPLEAEKYNELAGELRRAVDDKGILIQSINDKISNICNIDPQFQIDFLDMEQPYKMAFISKKTGEKFLLPENLGSGFNVLIAYALFAHVVEQEKTPVTLIIDEPELHLHTDWRNNFYHALTANKHLQVLYATQSEDFISIKNWKEIRRIADNKIYPDKQILSKVFKATDGTRGTVAEYLDDYAERNLHISLFHKENLGLFFTEKSILVEGPSERYALPKFLDLKGLNISQYSVSLTPVWGKSKLKEYQMLCLSFGINYFTLFDGDRKTGNTYDNERENAAILANTNGKRFLKFSSSFENLLGASSFNEVVNLIDNLSSLKELNDELMKALEEIQNFLEND